MLAKHQGIILKKIDYNDTSVIVKILTNNFGLQTYLINGVKSKKGAIRPSHLMPLNLVEFEAYQQQNKSFQRVKELRCQPVLNSLHYHTVKMAIAIFMAEVINKCIKQEQQSDEPLFLFLQNSILWLDTQEDHLANYPIFFLVKLSKYMGFYPKQNYSLLNNSFCVLDATFKPYNSLDINLLLPSLSHGLNQMLEANFLNYHEIKIGKDERVQLLNFVLRFYEQHEIALGNLNSYQVLQQIFN